MDGSPSLMPVDADVLARLVDDLPIGMSVRRRGETCDAYINKLAAVQRTSDANQRDTESSTSVIAVGNADFEVTLTSDISHHAKVADDLAKRAFYDELTGLPKRELFDQTLKAMIAEDCPPFALSFIDVDNFKFVNDYHGHAVGDQLLIKIVRRIENCMRPTDLLARVGGDEFVLLTTPLSTLEGPGPEVEYLSTRFREPFFIDGYEIFSSASIGTSIYPIHGADYGVLRANADTAMYQAKGAARGGICFYDPRLGHAIAERLEMEQRLRLAIRDRRLCYAFQPKVDFRSDTIVGMEVLLRWRDENGEIRAPGDIIKLAIELGLIDDITLNMLTEIVDQFDAINETFGPNASISINIAARQAGDASFMTRLAEALRATGCPDRFILELTEEALLSTSEFQTKILPIVRAVGARISIDDFGVGYSSLATLAGITADELKVDRSFITEIHRRPRNQSVLKIIEQLGNTLGMRVVVEGVETHEELAYLMAATRISCAQGFYFAKPIFLQKASGVLSGSHEGRSPSSRRELVAIRAGRQRSWR